MSFAIPLHKLRETPTLLAFYHPQPSYPVHILILPKRAIASLADLTAAGCPPAGRGLSRSPRAWWRS